jgi:hypothetical protein
MGELTFRTSECGIDIPVTWLNGVHLDMALHRENHIFVYITDRATGEEMNYS